MATMAELARDYTRLDLPTLAHLQRLVSSWGMLSDFCFADLLLFVPVDDGEGRFIVLGQVRPTTSQTVHPEDLVGHVIDEVERPLVSPAWRACVWTRPWSTRQQWPGPSPPPCRSPRRSSDARMSPC